MKTEGTTKAKIQAKVAILTLNFDQYALPVDDALAVLKLMKTAQLLDRRFLVDRNSYEASAQDVTMEVEIVAANKIK